MSSVQPSGTGKSIFCMAVANEVANHQMFSIPPNYEASAR